MIYFISKRRYNSLQIDRKKITVLRSLYLLKEFISENEELGFDREASHFDPYRARPLLCQFGNEQDQFVVDNTTIDIKCLQPLIQNKLLIGHNIKYDYKVSKLNDISFRKVYDTMIAEQVITKGSGLLNNLSDVVQRRLGMLPLAKQVRTGFIGRNKEEVVFTQEEIEYAAEDVKVMIPLKRAQMVWIDKLGLHKDLFEIEFPLVTIIGDTELKGFKLNEDAWRAIILENEKIATEYANKMNGMLRELAKKYPRLRELNISKDIKKEKLLQLDMFGGDPTFKENENKRSINYSSSTQVLSIFRKMGLPIPFESKKQPGATAKEDVDSVSETALRQYQLTYPENPLHDFIDTLIEYSKAKKSISSFGERFLVSSYKRDKKKTGSGYKNPITGKVHTTYRQCGTDTTRMASGNEREGVYNSQNIPKEKKYRNCFIADPGYVISTYDLSGAELVIGASLSKDLRLAELVASDDQHSPIAQACYDEVIDYIMSNMTERRQRTELKEVFKADHRLLNISKEEADRITEERVEFILNNWGLPINKKETNDLRDKFKSVNYGLAYGASAERIMEVLGIAKEYATIVEKKMKKYLPDFFRFLENKAEEGTRLGYVRFNDICGGRHWFKDILQFTQKGSRVPFHIKGAVERKCKNYPIQGTQGHMIKEATVRYFYEYVYPNNYDVTLLLQVHDELVIQHREDEPQHGEVLGRYMTEVAKVYLIPELTMRVEGKTLPYWTK